MNNDITTMREAFLRAEITPSFAKTKLAKNLLKVASSSAGVFKNSTEWNAKLSYKTAQMLKHQGVIK